jgi:hypothetical protein
MKNGSCSLVFRSVISIVDEVEISWQGSEGMEEICPEIFIINKCRGHWHHKAKLLENIASSIYHLDSLEDSLRHLN